MTAFVVQGHIFEENKSTLVSVLKTILLCCLNIFMDIWKLFLELFKY